MAGNPEDGSEDRVHDGPAAAFYGQADWRWRDGRQRLGQEGGTAAGTIAHNVEMMVQIRDRFVLMHFGRLARGVRA